jgi:type IV pilus assembly protein PilE
MRPEKLSRGRGFTLIEVVIAITVVAIIASIAYPSYLSSIRKSRRADAIQVLRTLQLAQERWRSNNPAYGTLANVMGTVTTSPAGWYTLQVTDVSATGYTATASAVTGSSQVGDTAEGVSCATLTINQEAPQFNPAGQAKCWEM